MVGKGLVLTDAAIALIARVRQIVRVSGRVAGALGEIRGGRRSVPCVASVAWDPSKLGAKRISVAYCVAQRKPNRQRRRLELNNPFGQSH